MRICFVLFLLFVQLPKVAQLQPLPGASFELYGTASYYADRFEGRRTASGQIFRQKKTPPRTKACLWAHG